MSTPHTFIFESYKAEGNTLSFSYAYENGPAFTETLELRDSVESVNPEVLDSILFALHIALGMSYWKAYAPKNIVVRSGALTQEQANFWNTVYTKGLGEFFYVNQIDFRGLVNFPAAATQATPTQEIETAGSLVPLGGGKDSLLTAVLLSGAKNESFKNLQSFSVNSYPIIEKQATHLGFDHFAIKRTIDPALLELNAEDNTYNGHVPISVIYGLCAGLQAIVNGREYVVLSNERSADEGNVEYLGEEINHQWSKSLEFEGLFQEYVHQYITPSVTYFSFLRPLSELLIVELVARFAAEHLHMITSCNKNFRIAAPASERWCGTCSKCASTFALFAFVGSRTEVEELFEGQNLFESEKLLDTYRELLGVKDHKPLDCVGTIDEMRTAFYQARINGFADTIAAKMFEEEVLPEMELVGAVFDDPRMIEEWPETRDQLLSLSSEHAMPKEAFALLRDVFGMWDRQKSFF